MEVLLMILGLGVLYPLRVHHLRLRISGLAVGQTWRHVLWPLCFSIISRRREGFTVKLEEVEDWLYEDGEDEINGVYVDKLDELKKQGDPIEERHMVHTERGSVIDQLVYCINSYREAAMSTDPKFDHIELSEKEKVLNECVKAEG
ncbi:heat shock 70 kDa protein 14-like [Impatiens glandulifera]|uniref:heat shock 70 kDa protein 14-like n=1 Tax=Impatiens glandulifera TaxID=253017 RepID=UPI001FB0DC75|nr:heat shock 70 kDa protein 14-like [Impatiens glandulifera]XP_047317853.1 heat shock 70 kDa protein 14-like [Impatiens glandulifera]